MKKCIVFLLCAALGISGVSEFGKIQEGKRDMCREKFADAINPFSDSDSLSQAEKLAGFSIEIPDQIKDSSKCIYRSIEQTLLEIIYMDEEENEIARIRKGTGEDDISGDYNEYPVCMDILVRNNLVKMKGEPGKIFVAVWDTDEYSYSVSTKGISVAEMRKLVGGIR